jgi:DNA invertase Pin-like site-specific DNA recombinase
MKTVVYLRVSSASQGRSGLGLEAQRAAVGQFCQGRGCDVLAEYVEVESGKRDDRPELARALHHADITGATLVIAKLDRLSRDAAFLLKLQKSGVRFIAADMPEACNLTVGILALVAQQEREAISSRTKAALAAAKARGTWTKANGEPYKSGKRLGNPNGAEALRRAGKGTGAAVEALKANADRHASKLAATVKELRGQGITSLPGIAKALNGQGVEAPRGGQWHASSVRNLLARIDEAAGRK